MKEKNDKWLKSLGERLNDYSKPLPEGDWEDFASKAFPLKKEKAEQISLFKRVPVWMRVAAVFALLLVPSAFVWMYFNGQKAGTQYVAEQKNPNASSVLTKDSSHVTVLTTDTVPVPIFATVPKASVVQHPSTSSTIGKLSQTSKASSAHVATYREDSIGSSSITIHDKCPESGEVAENQMTRQDSVSILLPSGSTYLVDNQPLQIGKHHKHSFVKWAGGISGGALASYLLSSVAGVSEDLDYNNLQEDIDKTLGGCTSFLKDHLITLDQQQEKVKARHLGFAASTAISARENISDHFAIDQTIFFQFGNWSHDMGMSIKAVWMPVNKRMWTVYLSAGPSYQLHLQKRVFDHKGLWSLQLSPGVQYNLSKHIGMYVEPNVSWFLNSDEHVDYGSSHVLPGTQVGFRFSF